MEDLGARDQDRANAAEGVEEGDQLRHLRHLDADGQPGADARADDHAADPDPGLHVGHRDGDDDGDQHADGAEQIAADGGAGVGHPFDAHDEQHGRDEIADVGDHARFGAFDAGHRGFGAAEEFGRVDGGER